MKRYFIILVLMLCNLIAVADVTFTVNVPVGTKQCYVVGGLPQLSSWSAGAAVEMNRVGEKDQFTVTVAGITTADVSASEGYKYICGPDWKYVEKSASGDEVVNRTTIGTPDVVEKWATMYESVGIIENYTIAGKTYPVQILLPSNYDNTKQHPVIYMFGRHQRYRDAGSDTEMGDRILYSDSWGVAQSVAELEKEGIEVGIVAVIYAQLPEFTPWENEEFASTGQASDFLKGFVTDFKPAFEKKYTVKSGKEACTIMGADVAGLFVFYAALEHPELFGRCMMFSPAFWYNKEELRDYINSANVTSNHFGFIETSADTDWTTDEMEYYGSWLYQKNNFVSSWAIEGAHDDRTWGQAFKNVVGEIPLTTKNTPEQSAKQMLSNADITWYFMKGEGTTTLTCDGTPTQKGSFYKDGMTPTAAQLLIKEIPVDNKKYTYYWNLNSGSNCDGELLMVSPKDIGFKNTRSTTSWQRVAVFADGTYEQSAASATNFKVNGVTMTVGSNYELSAEVSFTESKVVSVHYGSVNSGSDMGELVNATVSDNCLKAKVEYSYLTNKLTVTEMEWGSSDIDLEYFKVEPAVVHPGTPVKMSVRIADKNGYNVGFRMNHNNQSSSPITLTKGSNGEEYYTITNPEAGIYGFYLDIELNGTITKAHRAVYVKVVEGANYEPQIHDNPYADIDWTTINQYKSNLHTHTTQSNDAIDEFFTANVVDKYHAAGYKILALTDHDYNPYPWQLFPQYMSGVPARDPEALGMLAVSGNELSKDNTNSWSERNGGEFNHHNDFFTGRQGQEFASLQESYAYTYALGGLQIINHPGQYWSIDNTYTETQKNGPGWHANNFETFPSLVGLEVYNQGDRRANDRVLWDQILQRTMPSRNVFGYSGDDTHNNEQLFRNYNFMLMEDLSTEELKDAMRKGESYFCYEPKGSGEGKAPRISAIDVNENNKTITIEADGLIHWIYATDKTSSASSSARSTIVGIGKTFCYEGYQGSYVRAWITNMYGETCTQPISFKDVNATSVENVSAQTLALMLYPNPASAYLNVFMNSNLEGEEIYIYDLHGNIVLTHVVDGVLTTLPIQSLTAGMYIVQVGTRVGKFFKE